MKLFHIQVETRLNTLTNNKYQNCFFIMFLDRFVAKIRHRSLIYIEMYRLLHT